MKIHHSISQTRVGDMKTGGFNPNLKFNQIFFFYFQENIRRESNLVILDFDLIGFCVET